MRNQKLTYSPRTNYTRPVDTKSEVDVPTFTVVKSGEDSKISPQSNGLLTYIIGQNEDKFLFLQITKNETAVCSEVLCVGGAWEAVVK